MVCPNSADSREWSDVAASPSTTMLFYAPALVEPDLVDSEHLTGGAGSSRSRRSTIPGGASSEPASPFVMFYAPCLTDAGFDDANDRDDDSDDHVLPPILPQRRTDSSPNFQVTGRSPMMPPLPLGSRWPPSLAPLPTRTGASRQDTDTAAPGPEAFIVPQRRNTLRPIQWPNAVVTCAPAATCASRTALELRSPPIPSPPATPTNHTPGSRHRYPGAIRSVLRFLGPPS
eukprot:TRINITY_DN1714_c0_g1_i7.p1 TRINITY_DN1714_c0_g1~~TRINITY_DN1714_c0_g1_i7.p1  ORF type:complete len:230 (-),score=5.06 TRINITY_DN1714_c0_g1_i7:249-938(-)